MAADLFYFMASLPTLRWGEKTPFQYSAFLEKCTAELDARSGGKLAELCLLPSGHAKSDVARIWQDFETFLRNTVARIRQGKLKNSAAFQPRSTAWLSPGDAKRIEDAMALASPLERENALDLLRWKQLENMAAGHYFDMDALEIYALKLRLLEKQSSRNEEGGRKLYLRMTEDGLRQANDCRVELEQNK